MKQAKVYPFFKKRDKRISLSHRNDSHSTTVPDRRALLRWIAMAMPYDYHSAVLAVVFCNRDDARQYNADYRQKDYATNILSFALNEGEDFNISTDSLSGDLILCTDVVEEEALAQNKALMAHYAHLIVHGVLHLAGFDHMTDTDADDMEGREIMILSRLGFDNPYLEDELHG